MNQLKRKLCSWLLPKLINAVTIKDIISYDKTGIYLGGFPIVKDELGMLKEEIKFIEKTRMWGILTNTLAFKAIERIGEKSITFDDVWSGKMMLLNIELQKEILTVLKKYTIPKPGNTPVPTNRGA